MAETKASTINEFNKDTEIVMNKKAAYAAWGAVIWCGVSYLAWSVRYMEKNGKNREDNN